MEKNIARSWMSIISKAFHIAICCHHTGIDLTWAHSGVMGNALGTNYREPTGGDWATFCGLTFDCWVNSRMKTFNLLHEKQPNIKRELLWIPRKYRYVYRSNTFYCFVQLQLVLCVSFPALRLSTSNVCLAALAFCVHTMDKQ